MHYASEDLRNEHEGILFGLRILEKMVRLTEQDARCFRIEISWMSDSK